MRNDVVLGIDTSNYTTSLALVSVEGELIANLKRLLPVKAGECGLRQSDALFHHTKNLPILMKEMRTHLAGRRLVAVGVSTRPRNIEGSYMPAFLAGVASAEAVASSGGVPVYEYSHQCGHIMAALYSAGRFDLLQREHFCALHVSGGTTELLRVSPDGTAFRCEIVGGTRDLNAGQVIDRVGVYMGMGFPAGRELEAFAERFDGKIPKRRLSTDGCFLHLSGLENISKKMYDETKDEALVSAFTLRTLASGICTITEAYLERYPDEPVLFAGGVMSNKQIKEYLSSRLDASFAEPALSADNAVGIAVLARREYTMGK